MPWYCNPTTTCKVMNRIASRYPYATITDLNIILGSASQILWDKQDRYYRRSRLEDPSFTSDNLG